MSNTSIHLFLGTNCTHLFLNALFFTNSDDLSGYEVEKRSAQNFIDDVELKMAQMSRPRQVCAIYVFEELYSFIKGSQLRLLKQRP